MASRSVLIVDDEQEMRSALTHALKRNGYAVDSASSGIEGLKKFKKEDFGLVITDMKMPDVSGMDVLQGVKKISPQVPVIMITAYGTINTAVKAMKQGASDYILKPFSAQTLEKKVKKVYRNWNEIDLVSSPEKHLKEVSKNRYLVTQDPNLLKIARVAKSVADSTATILILGESGTGKELLASYIHINSGRSKKPYIAVNCAALPESLAESELFGHEKGSFTGAENRKLGKFELANNGTILLDEISEMSLPLQAKLLRVLQEREIDRVGGSKPVPINVRVISISNTDLQSAVKGGSFREDLFYRLNVIPLSVPPLRERKGDIPLLSKHFLKNFSAINGKDMRMISDETIRLLLKYDWKGNVRELENTIERAVLLGHGNTLLPKHLFLEEQENAVDRSIPIRVGIPLKDMERELILRTLEEVDGNRTHAADMLGISIRTLRNKLREYRGL